MQFPKAFDRRILYLRYFSFKSSSVHVSLCPCVRVFCDATICVQSISAFRIYAFRISAFRISAFRTVWNGLSRRVTSSTSGWPLRQLAVDGTRRRQAKPLQYRFHLRHAWIWTAEESILNHLQLFIYKWIIIRIIIRMSVIYECMSMSVVWVTYECRMSVINGVSSPYPPIPVCKDIPEELIK